MQTSLIRCIIRGVQAPVCGMMLTLCGYKHQPMYSFSSFSGHINVHNTHVELKGGETSFALHVNHMWLRDHCRCDKCYNHRTNQRILNFLDIPEDIAPRECSFYNGTLRVVWPDDHLSEYSMDWLQHNICHTQTQKHNPILWNGKSVTSLPIARENVEDFVCCDNDDSLITVLKSLKDFGVAFVENVPPTMQATQQVVERISHVERTFFGDMWEFFDDMKHSDTAYTKEGIAAHTDNTYFTEAAGLQVFHCTHHDGTGGETLLVDGFYAADQLLRHHPDSYQRLCSTIVEAQYLEPGRHYVYAAPILRLCAITGELEQIRYNLLDRAPLRTLPQDEVLQFYQDFRHLAAIISRSTSEWWMRLCAGTVVLLDNWRLLHGRAAYTGHRRVAGCYVGRADWHSKARVLGLL